MALVSALPRVDWGAVHTLGDELAGAAAEQKLEAFFDFLFGLLHRIIRARATGQGSGADLQLAQKLIGDGRLPHWARAWEELQSEKSTALDLNLDRKALILATVGKLEGVARGRS